MTLIKSISGIRGTIGGKNGDNLTPLDAVNFGCAYAQWIKNRNPNTKTKIVIGRDARISGEMIQNFVQYSIISMGIDIIDLGLSTTPTVELMVKHYNANGGIIITASHNPSEWNALKLLNEDGELTYAREGMVRDGVALPNTHDSFYFGSILQKAHLGMHQNNNLVPSVLRNGMITVLPYVLLKIFPFLHLLI